jgi:hypothetical protein
LIIGDTLVMDVYLNNTFVYLPSIKLTNFYIESIKTCYVSYASLKKKKKKKLIFKNQENIKKKLKKEIQ